MDSFDLQSTNSTESFSSDIADTSSMITPSKRDIFLLTYNRRQNFTLRDSMMHYIAKIPKNLKVYKKMIETCKYFFIKNPILIVDELLYSQFGWRTWVNETWKSIDINKLLCKLWITDELNVYPGNVTNNSAASSIFPKIYECSFKRLCLFDQILFYHEFMFLCTSAKKLRLHQVTVKNDDGSVVAFEKIVEQLPNVKEFEFNFSTPSKDTSKNTFKELWKIPHLSNYDFFGLDNIPESFDTDSFYPFIKKNKTCRVYLWFSDEISEEYKARLEAIIDEIIATKDHEYKIPCINFGGLDEEKYSKLHSLYRQ